MEGGREMGRDRGWKRGGDEIGRVKEATPDR